MAERLVIQGGQRLQGVVRISGAKNASLPAMAASLLTDQDCIIDGVPDIDDVRIMAEVLESLGARVEWLAKDRLRINATHIHTLSAPSEMVKRNRASFLVMGPLLSRFGEGASCPPGGDIIGQRPIDVHLAGFSALGAKVSQRGDQYVVQGKLRGAKVFMDYPSHIGTENLLMAAVLARGRTVIKHASSEPEVACLAEMLNRMGAQVRGAGTPTIEVEGVERLRGTGHRVIPDRLEAGTYAIAAAITGGEVELRPVVPEHMDSLVWKLEEMGVEVAVGDGLRVRVGRPLGAVNVQALPYPGFATDLQAAMGVLLTQARGKSVVHERVYDNRLLYVNELKRMGAQVEVAGQTAIIYGPTPLRGARVRALDIRSGAALVLAGLAAQGSTEIEDVFHLDRGYEAMDEKLLGLGAKIARI